MGGAFIIVTRCFRKKRSDTATRCWNQSDHGQIIFQLTCPPWRYPCLSFVCSRFQTEVQFNSSRLAVALIGCSHALVVRTGTFRLEV